MCLVAMATFDTYYKKEKVTVIDLWLSFEGESWRWKVNSTKHITLFETWKRVYLYLYLHFTCSSSQPASGPCSLFSLFLCVPLASFSDAADDLYTSLRFDVPLISGPSCLFERVAYRLHLLDGCLKSTLHWAIAFRPVTYTHLLSVQEDNVDVDVRVGIFGRWLIFLLFQAPRRIYVLFTDCLLRNVDNIHGTK